MEGEREEAEEIEKKREGYSGRIKFFEWPIQKKGGDSLESKEVFLIRTAYLFLSLYRERQREKRGSYNNAVLKGWIYSDNTAKGATRRTG